MPFANLPDAQIYYEWAGPEEMPLVVLSNSLGTTLRMWDPQVEDFTKHFRLLRYDTRGHGLSSATPGPYKIEQLGWDVVRLLNELQVDRVYFCGLSMGGMIGMYLAANLPKRFLKFVLCSTAAKIGTPESWNARIQTVKSDGMKAVAGSVIERWLTIGFRSSHAHETQAVQSMLEAANPQGYIANCAAVRDADLRESLAGIPVPCLVISGTHDLSTPPADGKALAQSIPGAKYAEVSAAHLSNLEARNDFNRQVLQFLLT